MKKLMKVLSLALVCALAMGILTACSGGTPSTDTTESQIFSVTNQAVVSKGGTSLKLDAELGKDADALLELDVSYNQGKITLVELLSKKVEILAKSSGSLPIVGKFDSSFTFDTLVNNNILDVNFESSFLKNYVKVGISAKKVDGVTYYAIVFGAK